MSIPSAAAAKAAFLDRDGVINIDYGYVCDPERLDFVPGAIEGLLRLRQLDFRLVLVTNQSGIARGLFTTEQYQRFNAHLQGQLHERGAAFDAVYHCPHHPDASITAFRTHCDCRKPAPGMLLRAIEELGIDPRQSFLVGDKESDIRAGRAAGIARCYLVGKNGTALPKDETDADGRYKGLGDCIAALSL